MSSVLTRFLAKRNGTSPNGEMSFIDHIEELRWHIIRSIIAVVVGATIAFIKFNWIFDTIILGPSKPEFVSYRWFCALGKALHIDSFCMQNAEFTFQSQELSGQFMTALSSSMMIGFILAFPFIFWEFWKFLKPALKPEEAKYARGIVLWTSLLFFLGISFSYFVIVPFTVNFFAGYKISDRIQNIFTISNYYDTLSNLTLSIGLVFELPIIVFFLSRVGIVTPKFLKKQRRYAYFIIFIVAEIITPPDWFSCFLVAIPMWGLYEASIGISRRAMDARNKRLISRELSTNSEI